MKRHSLTELLYTPQGSKAVKMSRDPMVTYSKISKVTKLKKNVLIRLFKLAGTIGRRKGRKLVRKKTPIDTRIITAEDLFNAAVREANRPTQYGSYGIGMPMERDPSSD